MKFRVQAVWPMGDGYNEDISEPDEQREIGHNEPSSASFSGWPDIAWFPPVHYFNLDLSLNAM